jgi:hypothetical protein
MELEFMICVRFLSKVFITALPDDQNRNMCRLWLYARRCNFERIFDELQIPGSSDPFSWT